MNIERISRQLDANEQLLYFTSTSLLDDDRRLVYLSDRSGCPNVFALELASGREVQLSRNQTGHLQSYVYFDGLPYQGLGKASICLHSASGTVYFIEGRDICRVDIDGGLTVLAQTPEGQMTGFTHVSGDGRWLCVPTVDARAFEGPLLANGQPEHNIDERVRAEGLSSYLRVFCTRTGKEVVTERVESCWITHVQFSPSRPDWILYNHEWPLDCGVRRMWLFDGNAHRRLRKEGGGKSRSDWVCHEMWERDGSAIIYHGKFADGPAFIGRVDPDGRNQVELPLPTGCDRYGHFTVGAPGVLVSDGYYEEPGDSVTWGGDWISRLDVDWGKGRIDWKPLCRSGSSWKSQDAHPHPIIDHGMRFIYFTSDRDGRRAIYRHPIDQVVG